MTTAAKVLRMGCKSAAESNLEEETTATSSSSLSSSRRKQAIQEQGEKRGGVREFESDLDGEEDSAATVSPGWSLRSRTTDRVANSVGR